MEKGSFLVDVCGSKTSLLKLPIISFRPRLSQKKCMQFYLAFEVKLYAGDWYNCTGKILRFFKIHLKQFAFISGMSCSETAVRRMECVLTVNYLTVLPWAWMGTESIAREAEGHEGERNNCLSKIQIGGQKSRDKTTLASGTRFKRHCFGFQSRRFSLLVGYNI